MDLEKTERLFLTVLADVREYLPDLTLVGGWMPYVYSNHLWKNFIKNPVTTVDIDFGVGQSLSRPYKQTIFQMLSALAYREKHLRIDRMFPVVLHKDKIPIEFITYPDADETILKQILGEQIHVNKIKKFEFLLRHRISIKIQTKKLNIKPFNLYCPKPSAFLYHKGVTFAERDDHQKLGKDLYYMYYILRYTPNHELLFNELTDYRKEVDSKTIKENLNKFFSRITGQGCLIVEKENGPDDYIHHLRQDIFDRFNKLSEVLSND